MLDQPAGHRRRDQRVPLGGAADRASTLDYVLEALFALALAFGAAAGFSLLRSARTWNARIGFALSGLGFSTVSFVAGATHVSGQNVLGPAFGLGLLVMIVGYLVLAVGDVRRAVTPRFAGFALLASLVAMIALGDGYGLIAWAAGWFGVAALVSPADVTPRTAVPVG